MALTRQFLIYIRGDSLEEVTEESLHLSYFFVALDLKERRKQGRNGEFEEFAVEFLALLQRCHHVYTTKTDEPSDER
jgi:hypothetical protein